MRLALLLLPLAVAVILLTHRAAGANADTVTVRDDGTLAIPAAARPATLRFAPGVAPADRAWILAATAKARPEARRLIDEVDGLVTVSTEAGNRIATGWTQRVPDGFHVGFNIGLLDGERAQDRDVTVLHELGHVIDFALIPPALDTRLDAGIPRGGSCGDTGGPFGGCAPTAERIADTFAKWALGGAVSAVGAGYQIAAPASLEDWGAPLGALATTLPAG
jgi:hypothetical protein